MEKYFADSRLYEIAPHHAGIKALWETKWKKPCSMGIYPFEDGKLEDFEKVFSKLIELDLKEPYDPEQYATPFFPVAEDLETRAQAAENLGDKSTAMELYMRAAAVYRIARFPINLATGKNAEAYRRGVAAYLKAGRYFSPPLYEEVFAHAHGIKEEVGSKIHVAVQIPEAASPSSPVPVILFITGLDGFRTDQTSMIATHVQHGFAVVAAEIPGTGDCPAIRNDPTSPDRIWSTILDWIATQNMMDSSKVVARGVSTGGFYAQRIVHTHRDRLVAGVSQGGAGHHMFDKRWIAAQNNMEYPFALADTLAHKFGYDSVASYAEDAQKRFSLLDSGLLDQHSAPLLLVNGMNDSIFPIEDSWLPTFHGDAKSVRFAKHGTHMGSPVVDPYVYTWIDKQVK